MLIFFTKFYCGGTFFSMKSWKLKQTERIFWIIFCTTNLYIIHLLLWWWMRQSWIRCEMSTFHECLQTIMWQLSKLVRNNWINFTWNIYRNVFLKWLYLSPQYVFFSIVRIHFYSTISCLLWIFYNNICFTKKFLLQFHWVLNYKKVNQPWHWNIGTVSAVFRPSGKLLCNGSQQLSATIPPSSYKDVRPTIFTCVLYVILCYMKL